MLFTGVAYSITAFPVLLCRILTELKLLDTTVGVVVLNAGVANDIIGWTLLAFSVALVNAGTGLMALYILVVCKTGSIEAGHLTMVYMAPIIIFVFTSAFVADIIGVHVIFEAFLVGLVVPRDGGLAIALTGKLEDMVGIILLPMYFILSGKVWGYTRLHVTPSPSALSPSPNPAGAPSPPSNFSWRESAVIGSLMSCKGLVELFVLNMGS
ncbi:K(+)/H(+) antiporter [Marasmius crinis-equi]|uniref:K(+)/H(+) antiporter n=1 Tax=Marasmius crinis-equi TaxID=585013 RepID=A0ABR3EKG7_9AGAR